MSAADPVLINIQDSDLPKNMSFDQEAFKIGNIHQLGNPDLPLILACNTKGWSAVYSPVVAWEGGSSAGGGVAIEAGISWLDSWHDSGHPQVGNFSGDNRIYNVDGRGSGGYIDAGESSGWIRYDVGYRDPNGRNPGIYEDPIAMTLLDSFVSGDASSRIDNALILDQRGSDSLPSIIQNYGRDARHQNHNSPYGLHRIIYHVRYGRRKFTGFISCDAEELDPNHIHGASSVGSQFAQTREDADILSPLGAKANTQSGGVHPEVIFYGGDIDGVQGYATVTADGEVSSITITDPGATVVDVNDSVSTITPPSVFLSTPTDARLFEGFDASVSITDNPTIIEDLYESLDLDTTSSEAASRFCTGLGYADPLAQTFLINGTQTNGEGIFISSIDVVFQSKPSDLSVVKEDIILELRPVTEGDTPARDLIKDMYGNKAEVRKAWHDIVNIVPGLGGEPHQAHYRKFPKPQFEQSVGGTVRPGNHTRFTFDVPVYLYPDTAYAFVLRSNDSAYRIWITDTREPEIREGVIEGTLADGAQSTSIDGRSRNQYGGALFKSQNGRSWVEHPEQDMMFRINRCKFSGSKTGTLEFKTGNKLSSDRLYDRIMVKSNPGDGTFLPAAVETKINYTFEGRSATSGDIALSQFENDKTSTMPERMILRDSGSVDTDGDFTITATLENKSSDRISPVVNLSRWQADVIKNKINNGGISNSQINYPATSTGSGFVANETLAVTGGGGTGAEIKVLAVNSDNQIESAYVSSAGSGYYKTATISSSGGASGTGGALTLTGEESAHGGNAKFRYVSKTVVLADGMDAKDIKVFITAMKPIGTQIYAYYKVSAQEDNEPLGDKSWKVMRQKLPRDPSQDSGGDFIEIEFDTGGENDTISYTTVDGSSTFDSFKMFTIKLVGFAESPTSVPLIKDFRAIAVT